VHPKVLIWETSTGNVVRSIGDGFFSRGVCAVCFSYDAKYICAVSCDEKHTFGIWDATNGNLITKATAGNDNPPQIRTVMWCPSPQYTGYISKEHDGHNDLFITGGYFIDSLIFD
jgi:WD40 repeat protein